LLFLDGNKRVALASSLAFIWLNNQRLEAGEDGRALASVRPRQGT
jgi:prophage maintenance system killer protein